LSLTLIVWMLLFVGLLVAAIKRSVFAVSLYMLTFFLLPAFWWWGDLLAEYRWNYIAGLVLLAASIPTEKRQFAGSAKRFVKVSLAILANVTFVNFVIAGNTEVSFDGYQMVVKMLLLTYLMVRTVRTEGDLKVVMMSILLGASYIGYECAFNDRGDIVGNRLEGVGAPGASTANHFASLMATCLPLVSPFFLVGRLREKIAAILMAPLITNVVLLCNSRGAFLSAIFSAIILIVFSPRHIRSKSIKVVAVGSLGVFLLLGDARIIDRFVTIFASQEDRDDSAASRLDFWAAGIEMVRDYPLGAGGNGFKKVHGLKYLMKSGASQTARAVHNGYINEACQWGIQGLGLRLLWFYIAILIALESIRSLIAVRVKNDFLLVTQISLLAALGAFLLGSLFCDIFDAEWGHWMVALIVATSSVGDLEIGNLSQVKSESLGDITGVNSNVVSQ
jgi:hypothetical protein